MTTAPVTSPTTTPTDAATAAAQQAATSQQTLNADKTQFLTLLTAQLKNQDPLSPMDSTEFTNQLVQFSAVEQQIDINSNLSTMISLAQQGMMSNAVNYIGKAIQADVSTAPLQNSQLTGSYTLSTDSQSTVIAITDAAGNVVNTQQGQTKAGTYGFTWDGKDSNGTQLPDGAYNVTVTALGKDNAPVTTTMQVFGTVTSVTSDPTNNSTTLNMGTVKVPLSKVLSIG
jgi:flagellar basal-body rod modification protein FlgD